MPSSIWLHPVALQLVVCLVTVSDAPEQRLLEKLFMADESIPLNVAMLGISPMVISSFIIQIILKNPSIAFVTNPYRNLINKKIAGAITSVSNSNRFCDTLSASQWDVERTSFTTAMVIGFVMVNKTRCIATLDCSQGHPQSQ